MIQANELRIGNWVLVNGKPVTIQILNGNLTPHKELEPIPLTLEILEKANLINITDSSCFTNKDNSVTVFKGSQGYYVCWEDAGRESSISIIGKPFHYVHQLQNLYFALTGEELKIEL
jgi:hypothetical protein